jgi:hypothetical protein
LILGIPLGLGVYEWTNSIVWALMPSIFGLTLLIASFVSGLPLLEAAAREAENELDLARIPDTSIRERAEKLFKLHQLELQKYYDQTLRHTALIFIVGIFCIAAGFGILLFTLYLVFSMTPSAGLSEKIVLASLGAVGSILANFIGVIYLRMYSTTIQSLSLFHNRLVGTHHLHFANLTAAQIQNDAVRERALAQIAEQSVKYLSAITGADRSPTTRKVTSRGRGNADSQLPEKS